MSKPFYHGTVKRIIVIFGALFREVKYMDDFGKVQTVPLVYSPREKWLDILSERPSLDTLTDTRLLPRIAFEMVGLNYAPERGLNPMQKIRGKDGKWVQYNRVAYDFTFNMYLATKQFEDGLKIVEQIIPMFNPSFNVTTNELDDFELNNDITITLDSSAFDIQYIGSYEDQRTIEWTLSFTVKAWLYQPTDIREVITKVITNFGAGDYDKIFSQFTSEVSPRTAGRNDPHTIIDERKDFE